MSEQISLACASSAIDALRAAQNMCTVTKGGAHYFKAYLSVKMNPSKLSPLFRTFFLRLAEVTNKKQLKQEILEKNSNHSFQLNIAEDEMAFTAHVQNEFSNNQTELTARILQHYP